MWCIGRWGSSFLSCYLLNRWIEKVVQSFEEESLFVPCSDALPVYVFTYSTKSSSWKAKERAFETAWEYEGRGADLERFSLPRRRIHTSDEYFFCTWLDVPLVKWFWLCNTHSNRSRSNRNGGEALAHTREGLDVIIRVIVIGNGGHDHLKILRTIATRENSLFRNNHTLAMFAEFQFEDIIFGIFLKVGGVITCAYG